MFLKNDTIYLFDFYKDLLRSFDRNGEKLDSTTITMHQLPKKSGWCNRLIQDPKTGIVYAVFDKGGYSTIRTIHLEKGTLGTPIRLDFRYVEKLIIHDNAIFYTHTGRFGFGWRQKLDEGVACEIMGRLSDEGFPFPGDFECSNGRKLSAD